MRVTFSARRFDGGIVQNNRTFFVPLDLLLRYVERCKSSSHNCFCVCLFVKMQNISYCRPFSNAHYFVAIHGDSYKLSSPHHFSPFFIMQIESVSQGDLLLSSRCDGTSRLFALTVAVADKYFSFERSLISMFGCSCLSSSAMHAIVLGC